jgi:hypothetical protein
VHDEQPPRRARCRAEPAQQLVDIGMGGEPGHGLHVRAHGHVGAEDPEPAGAVLQGTPARADRLVTHEQHRGPGIGQALA